MITTSMDLLDGLREPDNSRVWSQFCDRYRPVIVSFAKRLGLEETDREDAAQETLMAFVSEYQKGRYECRKGRLRSWLFGIAQHKVADIQRRKGREFVIIDDGKTTGFMNKVPDQHSMSELWEAEWRHAIAKICLDEVRKHVSRRTMQAFELITLKEMPTEKAAAELNMAPNALLKANRRVLSRMRELQNTLELSW